MIGSRVVNTLPTLAVTFPRLLLRRPYWLRCASLVVYAPEQTLHACAAWSNSLRPLTSDAAPVKSKVALRLTASREVDYSSTATTTGNNRLKLFLVFFSEDISPFRGASDNPVLDFWWRLPWISKAGWITYVLSRSCDHQIHLWCDTCWLYRGQYGSWAFSIHVHIDVSASIGGGSGQTGARTHDRPCRTQHAPSQTWRVSIPARSAETVSIPCAS